MRIGIIGSGQIGGTAAALLVQAGHEVLLSHAGGPESLRRQVADLGDARAIPGARLVKAFNTLPAADLARRGRTDLPVEERTAIPVAGDDADAKRLVAGLVLEVGFAPVDSGTLREGGRLQQPGGPLYARLVNGADAAAALRSAALGPEEPRPGA
jgi:predicted dinucleotide-binding enzyme